MVVYVHEANPRTDQRYACPLPDRIVPADNAPYSSRPGREAELLERECGTYDSCKGYYASQPDKSGWLISTDTEPVSCVRGIGPAGDGFAYPHFWRKTPSGAGVTATTGGAGGAAGAAVAEETPAQKAARDAAATTPTCAAITGALCPAATAAVVSRVTVDFGAAGSYEVPLGAEGSGFDSTKGFYVSISDGKMRYAKPGATTLTEVKLTRKEPVAGAVAFTLPTYTSADGSETVTVTEGKDPLEGLPSWAWILIIVGLSVIGFIIVVLVAIWIFRGDDRPRRVHPYYPLEDLEPYEPVKRRMRNQYSDLPPIAETFQVPQAQGHLSKPSGFGKVRRRV